LLTLHRAIKPQCERYARLYASVLLDELPTSIKEHEEIAGAIARGDADAAQTAAETNWSNAANRLAHIIWQHGGRGSWVGPRAGSEPTLRTRGARRGCLADARYTDSVYQFDRHPPLVGDPRPCPPTAESVRAPSRSSPLPA